MITNEEFEVWKERIESEDLGLYDIRQLVIYCSNGPAVSISLSKDDTIRMTEQVNDLWTKYQLRCKKEIVRRIKNMMLKFVALGQHGVNAMEKYCKLCVETREDVEFFCKDYRYLPWPSRDQPHYYNTWYSGQYTVAGNCLYIHMEDWFRGEVEEMDHELPLDYLDEGFNPMENEAIREYIEGLEFNDRFWEVIPPYPTKSQKEAFLKYLNENPEVDDRLRRIFGKE